MKIELKSVSVNSRMSDETNCFIADVYIDGTKAGSVENRGTGGANVYRPPSLKDRIEVHAATLGTSNTMYGALAYDADMVVDDLVFENLATAMKGRILMARLRRDVERENERVRQQGRGKEMYELVSPKSLAISQVDQQSNERTARKLVRGKGIYHGYMFRQVPDEHGNTTLKIVAEYIDAKGALQTQAER